VMVAPPAPLPPRGMGLGGIVWCRQDPDRSGQVAGGTPGIAGDEGFEIDAIGTATTQRMAR